MRGIKGQKISGDLCLKGLELYKNGVGRRELCFGSQEGLPGVRGEGSSFLLKDKL